MATVFLQDPNARQTVIRLGQPGLELAARAVAGAIPNYVPVDHGVMRRSYQPTVEEAASAEEGWRVYPGSPFWHWLRARVRHEVQPPLPSGRERRPRSRPPLRAALRWR